MSDMTMAGLTPADQVNGVMAVFDSVSCGEFSSMKETQISAALAEKSAKAFGSTKIPAPLVAYLSAVPTAAHGAALDSVTQAIEGFKTAHGCEPSADTVVGLLNSAVGMAGHYKKECEKAGRHLFPVAMDDVGASNATQSNNFGLGAGPVMTTVMNMMQWEMPFAGRLAADSGFGTFRAGVLRNIAASDFGGYSTGDSIDGVYGAEAYIDSERVTVLTTNGGGASAAFSGVVKTKSGGSTPLPFLVGLSEIRVNGLPMGAESMGAAYGSSVNKGSGSGPYNLAGSIKIGSTTHSLVSSTVTPSTGAYSIRFDNALPANTVVELVTYTNYEGNPDLAPVIGADIDIYDYSAKSSRAIVRATMESFQQASAELGVDIFSAANMTVRNKWAQERNIRTLRQLVKVGASVPGSWNMDFSVQKDQKNIAQVMVDFVPEINRVSAQMAVESQDTGASIGYVTGLMAQYLQTLPTDQFVPSGLAPVAGIYRLGRWVATGLDVYYIPQELNVLPNDDDAGTTTVLLVSRGSSTVRAPIIVADPIAPLLTPLADVVGGRMANFFFTKSATSLNKHALFRKGVATITVTGMK